MSAPRVSRRALGRFVSAGLVSAFVPVLAAGCSAEDEAGDSRRTPESGAGSKSPDQRTPDRAPERPDRRAGFEGRSPFTGLPVDEHGPVLAVKIDNVAAARPHLGLRAADLVYVEQVEAGLSRLIAVFSSEFPDRIGPVRSARESDLEILRQFGRPAFAYSGANEVVLSLLADAAPIGMAPDRVAEAYLRSSDRAAPHNLYLDPKRLLDAGVAADVSVARDIGFRFGPPPAEATSEPVTSRTVSYPAFELTIRPDRERGRWRLSMDGEPYAASPATVVIQRVRLLGSKYQRLRDYGSPFLRTTGEGEATVLRDGRAYPASWSRPTVTAGTTFRDADGDVINFTRGQTWVIYDTS